MTSAAPAPSAVPAPPAIPASRPAPPKFSRADWGVVLVLVAIQFTHMVDFVIIMPLGGRLMTEFNIGPDAFGWIVAAYAWAAGLASVAAAPLVDRFDRRHALLFLFAGFALSTLACGLAYDFRTMLLARAAAGVFGGLSAAAILAVIGDLFPAEKRGRATGAVMSAFAVASIAGLPLGLMLAGVFGRAAPFYALAGVCVAVWVLTWAKLPPVRGHLAHERGHPVVEFGKVLAERNHWVAFLFSFFTVMGTFTVASFIGPYLMATNGWGEDQLAVIYLAAGVCTLVGMNVVGRVADRVPRRPLFRGLAGAAIGLSLLVTNLPATSLVVATLALSAFMVFAAGRMVPAQAILLGAAVPARRGAFLSLNTALQHAATGLAPLASGALLTKTADGQLHGYPMVGLLAAGTAAVSLVLIGFVRPARA